MILLRTTAALAAALLLVGCDSITGDGVAAVANGYKITYDELNRYYQSQAVDQGGTMSEDQAAMIRLNLLRELIDRQLLLQRAEELGLMAVEEEVNERYETFRAPFPTEEEFVASLRDREMSRDDLRAEIRKTLTIEKLFNQQVVSRIKIGEAELRKYYDENQASFAVSEQQLHLAQILVTPIPESPVPNLLNHDATDEAGAEGKMRMLEERLAAGEDFAELAQNYSEDPVTTANGGDLGYVPQSSLENADVTLRRVVAALSPGDVSPVVETDGQYRIIMLVDREEAGQRDFADPRVQQMIRETLTNRKDQLMRAALLDAVRSEAKIKNNYAQRVVEQFGAGD